MPGVKYVTFLLQLVKVCRARQPDVGSFVITNQYAHALTAHTHTHILDQQRNTLKLHFMDLLRLHIQNLKLTSSI